MGNLRRVIKKTVLSTFLLTGLVNLGCASQSYKFKNQNSKKDGLSSHQQPLVGRERIDYIYTQAEAYSQQGQSKLAVELFREALFADPNSKSLKIRLAKELLKTGQAREAMDWVDLVIKEEPQHTEALLLKGTLLASLKNIKESINSFEKILVYDVHNFDARGALGALYAEEKQFKQARQQFEFLIQDSKYPFPEKAYYYLGRIYEEEGDKNSLKEAEKAFSKSIKLKPNFVEALLSLSVVLIQQEKMNEARRQLEKWQIEEGPHSKVAETLANMYIMNEEYEKAIEQLALVNSQSETVIDTKLKVALIQIENKKYKEASYLLESILEVVPDSDRVRFYLALVYGELNENEKALVHFMKVPDFSSFYVDSVIHGATLLSDMNRVKEGLALVNQALRNKPEAEKLYILYGSLLDAENRYDDTYEFMKLAFKKFPESLGVQFFYALSLDRKEQRDEAINLMLKIIDKDPLHSQALNYIAYTYAEMGKKLDEALELAQRALYVEPTNSYILDTVGWVYFQKGDYKEALVWLEKAFEGAKNEGVILEHLGDVYFKLGLIEKSKTMYSLALESNLDEKRFDLIRSKVQALQNPIMTDKSPERIPAQARPID